MPQIDLCFLIMAQNSSRENILLQPVSVQATHSERETSAVAVPTADRALTAGTVPRRPPR